MSNNTDQWYLSGPLGIGTTDPTHPIHVKADWGFMALDSNTPGQDSGLRLMEGGAVKWHIFNSAQHSKFLIYRDGFSFPSLTIDESGRLGFGTMTPTHPLHVKTDWGFLALDTNGPGQDSGIRLMEGGAVKWHIFNSAQHSKLLIYRDGFSFPSLTIDESGRLGFGTMAPTHALHVKTDWGFLALDTNTPGQDSGIRLMEGGAVKWHIYNSAKSSNLFVTRDGLGPSLTIDQVGNIDLGANPIRFSSRWTGSPDAVTNRAEISNDTFDHKTLMIIGNKSAGLGRRVSVWDRLEVNGTLAVTENITWGNDHSNEGYVRIGNLQIAWGKGSFSTSIAQFISDIISFPMPFSANSPSVTISINDPGFGAVTFRGAAGAYQVDPNGFRVLYKKGDSFPKTEKHDIEYSWIAIGSFT